VAPELRNNLIRIITQWLSSTERDDFPCCNGEWYLSAAVPECGIVFSHRGKSLWAVMRINTSTWTDEGDDVLSAMSCAKLFTSTCNFDRIAR
jgi:hypothetical protein